MDEKQVSETVVPPLNKDLEDGQVLQLSDSPAILKAGLAVHPQPTADPLDPLNWSFLKKHTILGIVMFKYFLFTYITTTTVPSFPELQESFNISYAQVNWTVAIPALGLTVGAWFWAPLADIYGRRLVFIIGTIISLASTVGAGGAMNFEGYMAARFFQGFGIAPGAVVGLAVVNDMFFDFERGQKIGLWTLAIDTGLLIGPLIGGFVGLVGAEWIQWLTAIMLGVLLILEFAFMTETLYPRNRMLSYMPMASDDEVKDISTIKEASITTLPTDLDIARTSNLPFISFNPIPGVIYPKLWESWLRFFLVFKYTAVSVPILIYSFSWYWWILSVITMLPAAYPDYAPHTQGLLFLGLILGTLFSEILCSGRLGDAIVMRLAKRNGSIRTPEMRLWLAYPAALLSSIGLILWGISVDRSYHWIVGQVAFFIFAAGIQMGNTVLGSYVVDSYPLQSVAVITFYAVILNLSAFVDPFFIATWQAQSGWTWCFAVQGMITFFVGIPVFAFLHYMGPKLRKAAGEPSWVNPEYST